MIRIEHFAAVFACFALLNTPTALGDEAHTAHRMVARSALKGLAPQLQPVFEAHRSSFVDSAVEPGTTWTRDRSMSRRKRWHDVQADVAAEEQNLESRIRAFDAFPRTERDAQRLYRRSSGRNGGRLPWAIAEIHQQLIEAFRSGDALQVTRQAGHLAHFVTDAANPFRVTANHDGSLTGNATFGPKRGVHSDKAPTVRERFGVALFAKNMADYESHIRVADDSAQQYTEPLQAAFALMELSVGVVDHIATVDREVLGELEITDEQGFAAKRSAYLDMLDERCGDIAVSQLSAAATTTAQLINAAWMSAGKPAIGVVTSDAATPTTRADGMAGGTDGAYVGSKNSNVFHKRGCRFARQIVPENLVSFPTSAAANQAGRRGCRACKPE